MSNDQVPRLLFVVNPKSGDKGAGSEESIREYFIGRPYPLHIISLSKGFKATEFTAVINEFKPDRIIAVGGDGTVKFAAEQLIGKSDIMLGIIPAGSANGMAKELGIPADINKALELVATGEGKTIHLVEINQQVCIHLADIGFNAFVIKMFERENARGMWGYLKASVKALWQHRRMIVKIKTSAGIVQRSAAMVVIANATRYGSGALINPGGKLDDEFFEVIVVRKISFSEIFKMLVTHLAYDPAKTEVFQTAGISIQSKRKAHFQVDGEYLGKTNRVEATLLPAAIKVIVPGNT